MQILLRTSARRRTELRLSKMIEVDIRTRIVAENHNVVIARPGSDYRLYFDFLEGRVVGPELPSLFLEGEKIDPRADDMGARVQRAKERKKWHRNGGQIGSSPSLDLNEYAEYSSSQSIRQLERVVRYYFESAKRGDLVVVPPKSFAGDAQVGEFIDDPSQGVLWNCRFFLGDPLPVRRVKWLGQLNKRDLPAKTIDTLRKPTAFFLLEKSLRSPIYRTAYRNYHLASGEFTSIFDVTTPDFNTRHGSVVNAFFNFVAANTKQIAENSGEVFDFAHGAFANLGDYSPELAVDIQSPGILSLTSRYVTPLVASALLALALTVGADAADPKTTELIRIGNSSAPADDPCVIDVQKQVHAQLKLLGYTNWAAACEHLKGAAGETGLKSESIIKP
jgi:hypothetical protein